MLQNVIEERVWSAVQHYSGPEINVAFSGGIDSSVLLDICANLRGRLPCPVYALHVNHGWSSDSDKWELSCRRQAEALKIHFKSIRLVEQSRSKPSESIARENRYRWFSQVSRSNAIVLTAHHADDQLETFLFRLLRGASVSGLGGMREDQLLYGMRVIRPMLKVTRDEIYAYAENHNVKYLQDSSNDNDAYDRNYIRNQVIPSIERRWPQTRSVVLRTSQGFREIQNILDETASQDLEFCGHVDHSCRLKIDGSVGRARFLRLSADRQSNLLRFWFRIKGFHAATEKALQEFLRQVRAGAAGSRLVLRHEEYSALARVSKEGIFIVPGRVGEFSRDLKVWDWPREEAVVTDSDLEIRSIQVMGKGVSIEALGNFSLELRWKRGNIRVRPAHANHRTRSLRVLLQEMRIPSWERARIPMVYAFDQFVCMPGVVTEAKFAATKNQPGVDFLLRDLRGFQVSGEF
ncbi:MAG: tRNA lysidine(34) synthetase TilS [Proteobacteria bacterium]|nr:tRNA lysidine(34) synthetase TilS [Pseudomonadota bacterium]